MLLRYKIKIKTAQMKEYELAESIGDASYDGCVPLSISIAISREGFKPVPAVATIEPVAASAAEAKFSRYDYLDPTDPELITALEEQGIEFEFERSGPLEIIPPSGILLFNVKNQENYACLELRAMEECLNQQYSTIESLKKLYQSLPVSERNQAFLKCLWEKVKGSALRQSLSEAHRYADLVAVTTESFQAAVLARDIYKLNYIKSQCSPERFTGFVNDCRYEDKVLLDYMLEKKDSLMCQYLIRAGADIQKKFYQNTTYMHWFLYADMIDVCELLLERGLSLAAVGDEGRTPLLFIASQFKQGDSTMRWLLDHKDRGVDLNAQDKLGNTALHYATQLCFKEYVQMLLSSGADPNITNKDGRSPLAFARATTSGKTFVDEGNREEIRRLFQGGAAVANSSDQAAAACVV